eukprot:gnl/Spiro4/4506_TR2236_c0_g1_i1.p1 gnl/Spiro4/4506_TR2236_c0_g1~~gnl/Spiro4/4506_TR2236_c0_g1_i1.p1  ORF type:complete len:806 (+),score=180.07 gnl/Spiro4/4506_TR2236_c0_g1_i1:33-2420(+)
MDTTAPTTAAATATITESTTTQTTTTCEGGKHPIRALFETFDVSDSRWRAYLHFGESRFTRNLVSLDQDYSLLAICWKRGQNTPIHSHGVGTKSWVRVLRGELRQTFFSQHDEEESHRRLVPADGIVECAPDNERHSTECRSKACVSLHLYSPPYLDCTYRVCGKRMVIPVVYTSKNLYAPLTTRQSMYTNFSQLTELLRSQLRPSVRGQYHPQEHISYICRLLDSITFNPNETAMYAKWNCAKYTRNLVGFDENFTILILCWDRSQLSRIHDHAGSGCWVKVLQGTLTEERFAYNPDGTCGPHTSSVTYRANDGVAYINDTMGLHRMGNADPGQRCASLHVYSPPFRECNVFSEAGAAPIVMPMTCVNSEYEFMDATKITCPCPDTDAAFGLSRQRSGSGKEEGLYVLVAALKECFNKHQGKFSCELNSEICGILRQLNFDRREWQQYMHFGDQIYTRNLLASDKNFSLILNCWHMKQGTPIHTHESNSVKPHCWMRVLEGQLKMSKYRCPRGHQCEDPYIHVSERFSENYGPPIEEHVFTPSCTNLACAYMCCDVGLHKMENPSDTDVAVSLHLYSPPYIFCCYQDSEGKQSEIPVAYCSSLATEALKVPEFVRKELHFSNLPHFLHTLYTIFSDARSRPQHSAHDTDKEESLGSAVLNTLRNFQIAEDEWQQYVQLDSAKPTGSIVAYNDLFSVYVIGYMAGQSSRIHDHAGSCYWSKVLHGVFSETRYEKGSVTFRPGSCVHQTRNPSQGVAYTLAVFSPPVVSNFWFDDHTGFPERKDFSTSGLADLDAP